MLSKHILDFERSFIVCIFQPFTLEVYWYFHSNWIEASMLAVIPRYLFVLVCD